MGLLLSKDAQPKRVRDMSLKLEAQRVKEFTGHFDGWQKWKSRTECAFDGSGYEKVLSNRPYAEINTQMNRVVYAQLYVATVEGTAHHLVKQHETLKDGHAAWNSLCEWYDGDIIKNETAETLRSRIEALKLHSGGSASDFVNKYLMYYHDLAKIPGEGLSASHGIYLFLRNITAAEYASTVSFLRNTNPDLMACVTAIRKAERDCLQKKQASRQFRQTIRRMKEEISHENTKRRWIVEDDIESDSEDEYPKKKKIRHLNGGERSYTASGCLKIPSEMWYDLPEGHRTFVMNYNSKITHKDSVEDMKPPDGFIFPTKARQMGTTPKETSVEKEKKDSTLKKKKIRFNLEKSQENDDGDDQDE
jgi:hypothetical protein